MPEHPTVVLATPAWSLNGPNVFSANLARELNARRIRAKILVTRPDWVDAKPLPRPSGIRFETLEAGRFASLETRWNAMIRYLEQQAPCIYIPNYDFSHSCVSPRLTDSIVTIGIIHSDDAQHYEHVRRLGRYWNAVVAVSGAVGAETLKIDPSLAPRLSMIPYGIAAAPALPSRSAESGSTLRLVYAGRLDQAQKRVFDLPAICEAAIHAGVALRMTILGSGPAERELRARFAASAATNCVDFAGTLDNSAIGGVLSRHDVFLLASGFEGLPIGLLEAMGQGCVPVVSDIRSGVGEIVQDGRNGFRVAVGDIAAFAHCLSTLFHNSALLSEMAHAAYRTVSSGPFRLELMVQRYVELFARVIEESRLGEFRRPAQRRIVAPADLSWQEFLPGRLQQAGHYTRQILTGWRC